MAWPRRRMAELAESLFNIGAAAVAFDVLFSEPDGSRPPCCRASLAVLMPHCSGFRMAMPHSRKP